MKNDEDFPVQFSHCAKYASSTPSSAKKSPNKKGLGFLDNDVWNKESD